MAADSGVAPGSAGRPSAAAQNAASLPASPQSMLRASSARAMVSPVVANGRNLASRREKRRLRHRRGWRRPGLDGGAAAVGGEDRAGDVAGPGRGEEGDDLGDLARLGGAGEQGGGAEGLDAVGRGSAGQDWPGSDGVDTDPGGTEFGCPGT